MGDFDTADVDTSDIGTSSDVSDVDTSIDTSDSADISDSIDDVPEDSDISDADMEDVDDTVDDTPDEIAEDTDDVEELDDEVAEDGDELPEDADEIPEDTEETSEMDEEVAEESDELPEDADEIPEDTEESSEMGEEVAEESDELPEDADEIPEDTEETSEMDEEIAEESDELPEDADEIPEDTEEPSEEGEEVAEAPEETEELPEEGEEAVETSEETEDAPKVLKRDDQEFIESTNRNIDDILDVKADDYRDQGLPEDEISERLAQDKEDLRAEFLKDQFPDGDVSTDIFDSAEPKNYDTVADYMGDHNYSQGDFDTYSQDPQWRELMEKEYPDYELPPMEGEETGEPNSDGTVEYTGNDAREAELFDILNEEAREQNDGTEAESSDKTVEYTGNDAREAELFDILNREASEQNDAEDLSDDEMPMPDVDRYEAPSRDTAENTDSTPDADRNDTTDTNSEVSKNESNDNTNETQDATKDDIKEQQRKEYAETLKDFMEKKGYVEHADFSDFDPHVAYDLANSVLEAKKDFPDLEVNYLGSIDNQVKGMHDTYENEYFEQLKQNGGEDFDEEIGHQIAKQAADDFIHNSKLDDTEGTYAWSMKTGSPLLEQYDGVAVNNEYAADYDKFHDSKHQDMVDKWSPIGCDTPKSVTDHELGHEIDKLVGGSDDEQINKMYNEMMEKGDCEDRLSGYSAKNVKEFIAEAYSEYRNNPTPRDTSTAVYNRLIELRDQKTLGKGLSR